MLYVLGRGYAYVTLLYDPYPMFLSYDPFSIRLHTGSDTGKYRIVVQHQHIRNIRAREARA